MNRPAPRARAVRASAMLAVSSLLLAGLSLLHGCAGEPEFDKAAEHTPESLVHEFLVRYRRLPELASPREKAIAAKLEKAKAAVSDPDEGFGKSAKSEAAVKRKAVEKAETLESLIDTLEVRLGRLKGISRPEAARKVMDLIEKEQAIREEDRQAIVERLGKVS